MPRRKAVPQHRTVADADAGLKAVLAEYREQLKAKDAEVSRLCIIYSAAVQDAVSLRSKVDVLSKAIAQEAFNAIV